MEKNNSAKIKKLIFWGLFIEVIYLFFFFIAPKYLPNLWPGENNFSGKQIAIILTILLISYIAAYRHVLVGKKNLKIIVLFFLLFNFTLLIIWPIGVIDIFNYIGWSRVLTEHGANPYLTAYSNFHLDSFYHIINIKWLYQPTPYGPLFALISGAITFLAGNNLLLNLFIFKLFFVAINILNLYIIHKIFRSNHITFLYAWNPLILQVFALNGHSDVLTVFFFTLSLYFIMKQKNRLKNYIIAWTLLILSALIKYMTLVLLPIFFLIMFFTLRDKKDKVIFFFFSFLGSIIITLILFLPFGIGSYIFSTSSLYFMSPFIYNAPELIPPAFTYILFLITTKLNFNDSFYLSVIIGRFIFTISYCFIIIKIISKRNLLRTNDIIKYSCLTFALFISTFFSWVLPWYYALLIVLLIFYSAINKHKYNNYVYGITLFALLHYLLLKF